MCQREIAASGLPCFGQVVAIGIAATGHRAVPLQRFNAVAVRFRCLFTCPADLQLETAVTKVSGHGKRINQVVVGDFGGGFRVPVFKKNVFYTVETEKGRAQTLTSGHIAVLTVQGGKHIRTIHQGMEGILVQRPGVNVGVNAKITGGAEQKGLALLPPFAGIEENLTSLPDIRVGLFRFQGGNSIHQVLAVFCKFGVSGDYRG